MRTEIERKTAEAEKTLLSCRHCGQPARLEECWDISACSPSVQLMIHCRHCGIGPESPYGSTATTCNPASAIR
jgi:hypothetical protein